MLTGHVSATMSVPPQQADELALPERFSDEPPELREALSRLLERGIFCFTDISVEPNAECRRPATDAFTILTRMPT